MSSQARLFGSCLIVLTGTICAAQETTGGAAQSSAADITKLKQNPVGGLRCVYLQNMNAPYGEGIADSFSIQPVWPFPIGDNWKVITYTIVPIEHFPASSSGNPSATGLGNILFNGFFVRQKKKGNFTLAAGPALELPTRTDSTLGSNRVSLGPTALVYDSVGSCMEKVDGQRTEKANSALICVAHTTPCPRHAHRRLPSAYCIQFPSNLPQ